MNDEEEKNIDKEQEDKKQIKQPEGESQAPGTTSAVEEKKEVIHKKNGRLHIYVRQDKYKGELKSHNWVGRLYIDGKQKIFSSGTTNIEEAIPILEKWFDDVHANRDKKAEETTPSVEKPPLSQEMPASSQETPVKEEKKEDVVVNQNIHQI